MKDEVKKIVVVGGGFAGINLYCVGHLAVCASDPDYQFPEQSKTRF